MKWTNTTPVLIYGAGVKGTLFYDKLQKLGFNCIGFLDKQAERIAKQNVWNPCHLIEEIKKEDTIVICSVLNVYRHRDIAKELQNLGYKTILYMDLKGTADSSQSLFSMLWEWVENYTSISDEAMKNAIDHADFVRSVIEFEDNEIICEKIASRTDVIRVLVPVGLLYSFSDDNYSKLYGRTDFFRRIGDRQVYYYLYCGDIYSYFNKGMDNIAFEKWINEYKQHLAISGFLGNDYFEQNVDRNITSRRDIYYEMNILLQTDPNFFKEHPIILSYNEKKDIFNIIDGNNRLGFLKAKGTRFVWCQVKSNELELLYQQIESLPVRPYSFEMEIWQAEMELIFSTVGKKKLLDGKAKVLFDSDNILLRKAIEKMDGEIFDVEGNATALCKWGYVDTDSSEEAMDTMRKNSAAELIVLSVPEAEKRIILEKECDGRLIEQKHYWRNGHRVMLFWGPKQ